MGEVAGRVVGARPDWLAGVLAVTVFGCKTLGKGWGWDTGGAAGAAFGALEGGGVAGEVFLCKTFGVGCGRYTGGEGSLF